MKLFRVLSFSTLIVSLHLLTLSLSAQSIELRSQADLERYLGSNKPLVLDFHAEWCGVCKKVKPMVTRLENKYSDVDFILIDGDKFPKLVSKYNVKGFPTFVFISQGQEVQRISGMKPQDEMENAIEKIRVKREIPVVAKEPEPKALKEEPAPEMKKLEAPKSKKTEPVKKTAPEKEVTKVALDKNVVELGSMDQLDSLHTKKQPMMYDFYTTWCTPCKQMRPLIEDELSKKFNDVLFIAIDAEKFPDLAKQHGVTGYPTFVFLDANAKSVGKLSGACSKILMEGKLGQISKVKSSHVVVTEDEMKAMQAQGKVPGQPQQTQMQQVMPAEKQQPMQMQPPKTKSKQKRNNNRRAK